MATATKRAGFWRPTERMMVAIGILAALIGALLAPPAAFSIDEAIYIDMAGAMTDRGAFDITPQDMPKDAPILPKSDRLVHVIEGRAVPQYPGAYGVFAAPFFLTLGVNGLVLLNVIAALCVLLFTYRIARRLGLDDWTNRASVVILAAASIFAGYVFAVWPHMLSLAFVMAGAFATVCAGDTPVRRRWRAAALAGLLIGLGAAIRVDVILGAVAAFFWLRIFSQPGDRGAALALLAGLVPGAALSAMINQAKFGILHPFSYGEAAGGAAASAYSVIILAVVFVALAALAIDSSNARIQTIWRRIRAIPVLAVAGIALAGAIVLWYAAPRLATGLYVLLVDIQAFPGPAAAGLERNAYGFWNFWDIPKKALLQSMAYLPLAVLPVAAFFRGKSVAATSFLLLFAGAPVVFFALNAWHGGMSYNMRYYLPATPFLVILCAMGLAGLRQVFDQHENLFLRSVIAGVFVAVALYAAAPGYGESVERPLQLYPQLVIALGLACAVTAMVADRRVAKARLAAAALGAAALGNAAMLSLSDMAGYWATRAAHVPYDRAYAALAPNDALIITAADEYLVSTSLNGAAVVRAAPQKIDALNAQIDAYTRSGRCVFVHTPPVADLLGEERFEALPMPANAPRADLSLFVFTESPDRCRR